MNHITNCGIYKIKNKVNGNYYVGSSIMIESRIKRHKRELINEVHSNIILQRAWNKYGEDSFLFEVVCVCNAEVLLDVEQTYLDHGFNEHALKMYNIAKNSLAPMTGLPSNKKGKKLSDETRKRMSESKIGKVSNNKGNIFSDEVKKKMSLARTKENNSFWGKQHTNESKKKMSMSLTGRDSPFKGKKHTKESLKKMSESQIGRVLTQEHIEKIRISSTGRKHSAETLKKMSDSSQKIEIVKLDKKLNYICKYEGVAIAGRNNGVCPSGIVKVCKGKNKTAGGYKWMYLKDYEAMK